MKNTDWADNFSYSYYIKILKLINSLFKVAMFSNFFDSEHFNDKIPIILIRHDVDLDPEKAVEMAEIEKDAEVRATYMFIVNSHFYKVDSVRMKKIFQKILSLDHEIGLHYNPEDKLRDENIKTTELEKDMYNQKKILQNSCVEEILSVSFHIPMQNWLHGKRKLCDMVNTYSEELMSSYMSDSMGRWRCGNPIKVLSKQHSHPLQMLTHPIWWGKHHGDTKQRLKEFLIKNTRGMKEKEKESFDELIFETVLLRTMDRPIEKGEFDTDTKALDTRINTHSKYGTADFDGWVLSNINLEPGLSILDLGSGTGKFTIPMAKTVGNSGRVYAFDISKESLDVLSEEIKNTGLKNKIKIINSDFTRIKDFFDNNYLDRILGSYTLYYSTNAEELFNDIYEILKPGGLFFYCGPTLKNNLELRNFHFDLLNKETPEDTGAASFMEKSSQAIVSDLFNNIEISNFENPLEFSTKEALYNYWSSYNLYDKSLDKKFREKAEDHFKNHNRFTTVKRVIGIKCYK